MPGEYIESDVSIYVNVEQRSYSQQRLPKVRVVFQEDFQAKRRMAKQKREIEQLMHQVRRQPFT